MGIKVHKSIAVLLRPSKEVDGFGGTLCINIIVIYTKYNAIKLK